MVTRLAGALALACAAVMFAGCATIVHGTTEKVYIDSTPGGAEVDTDDSQHLITPAEAKLARGSAHTLVFHRAGYEDATANLTSSFSGWTLGNVLVGGALGMVVDAADGASRSLSSDSVNVKLTPLPVLPPLANAAAGVLEHQAQAVAGPATAQPLVKVRNSQNDESGYTPPAMEGPSPRPLP
jgi:PEGA domain